MPTPTAENHAEHGFSTRAIHAGQGADPATGATVVPIYATSTFTQEAPGRHKGYEYSRSGNPTRAALETCLAALENGERALAFASGLAATTAVLSTLRPGDSVVAAADLYGGTFRLLERVFKPWGLVPRFTEDASPRLCRSSFSRHQNGLDRDADQPSSASHRHRCRGRTGPSPRCLAGRGQHVRFSFSTEAARAGGRSRRPQHDKIPGGPLRHHRRSRDRRPHSSRTDRVLPECGRWCSRPVRCLADTPRDQNPRVAHGTRIAGMRGHLPTGCIHTRRSSRVYYPGLPEHPNHDVAAGRCATSAA